MSKVSKSYQGYTENTYATRKGRLCLIKKIHFEVNPPDVTVLMMDNDCEVGTEFNRLRPLEAWLCDLCTARNTDADASKCCFCGGARTFKEQIIVKEGSAESTQSSESADVDATDDEAQSAESAQHCESESSEDEFVTVEHEPEPEEEDDDDIYADTDEDEDSAQTMQHGADGRDSFSSAFREPMYGRSRPKPSYGYRGRSRRSPFASPFGGFGFW